MKSFVRWSATLGLIAGTVMTSWLGQTLKALALPQEEILKILQPIPVFTVINEEGAPLIGVLKDKDGKDVPFTQIFISRQDAQQFFQQLKKEQPEIASKFKVQFVSLGEVYKLENANADKPDGLQFAYIPRPQQIESAQQVLKENNQEYRGGVPLFVARGGPQQGYLLVEQNNEQIIPLFFEKEQIQRMIDGVTKNNPELASTLKIEVIPLEIMIATLEQKDDEGLKKFRIWPSQEMIQLIQSQSNAQNQQRQ